MTPTITLAPVRRSVTVPVAAERAFETFAAGMGRWWPASHSIGRSPLASVVVEPRRGGRWYEVGADGSECDWGEVLAWEPPQRLLLAWRLGTDWRFDPALLTEVEVRFEPAGPAETRVTLEHRLLENLGADAARARTSYDGEGGWGGLLAAYAAVAGA
jgi:uncharacterized protein YndB with AHSA1/START domain